MRKTDTNKIRLDFVLETGEKPFKGNPRRQEGATWNQNYVEWLEMILLNPPLNRNLEDNSIVKLLKQARSIAKGYTFFFLGKIGLMKEEKIMSQKRMAICKTCPLLDSVHGACTECGCILAKKTLVKEDKCPKGQW